MPIDSAPIRTARTVFWSLARVAWFFVGPPLFRLRASGTDTLPKNEGYVLFANHTAAFDHLWLAAPIGRPLRFMASAHMFANPVMSVLLRIAGAFPKQQFVRDDAAASAVADMLEAGEIVQIMPEGLRTWDGTLWPIRPGTGAFVLRNDATVVCARIRNGHLAWPRWSRWPRWVPVRVDFDPPRKWPKESDPVRVTEEITRALSVPTTGDFEGRRTWSRDCADDVTVVLWACPVCRAGESLRVVEADRNQVRCGSCAASWRMLADNTLQPTGGKAEPTDLAAAARAIREACGSPPVADRAAYEADGTALVADGVRVLGERVEGPGRLRLTAEKLELGAWSLRLADVQAITLDVGNVLLLRTSAGKLRIDPGTGSVARWEHFLSAWWARAKG